MYGLRFADELSEPTRKELESFLSALRAWASVAHDDDGTPLESTVVMVPYSASTFTAGGGGTWTVGAGDQVQLQYRLNGHELTMDFLITSTTVAGTVSELRIALPAGLTARHYILRTILGADNGTQDLAFASVLRNGTYISIQTRTGANWSAATDATSVWGSMTCLVN